MSENHSKSHRKKSRHKSNEAASVPLKSIVRVFSSLTSPDYHRPWQMLSSEESSGSGFAIEGRLLVTNAHVVERSTFISVRRYGSANKIPAKLKCISYDCDLALLEVEGEEAESFWSNVETAVFADDLPNIQDKVFVAGFPIGGDNISVTRGIVSRIEFTEYTPTKELLSIQIDAAVNSGNSGGPVFKNGRVIGVAFSGLDNADGISYIIPVDLVQKFVSEVKATGTFRGICGLGLFYQPMENRAHRRAYNMKPDQSGVLVLSVDPMSPASGLVEKGDILMAIDDISISNTGTVDFRKSDHVHFRYLFQRKRPDEKLKVTLLRNGEVINHEIILSVAPDLVISTLEAPSDYIVWAGLVFVPLSYQYMDKAFGEDWENAPSRLVTACLRAKRERANEQPVILSMVLSDKITAGYEDISEKLLSKVNGELVLNLADLLRLIEKGRGKEFIKFELESDYELVFDYKEAEERLPEILTAHKIPAPHQISNPL